MLIEEMTTREYKKAMLLYSSALKDFHTKLDIINEEFALKMKDNPIEHIKVRLKSPQSIAAKLIKRGYEPTIENAVNLIDDIAGVRIICSFTEDIYKIVDVLETQDYIKILKVKDYLRNPKVSGYRSYHMILEFPVHMAGEVRYTRIEVQIRTIAMDFWASLEHKIRYKFESEIPTQIHDELLNCADIVAALDRKMYSLNGIVEAYKTEQ